MVEMLGPVAICIVIGIGATWISDQIGSTFLQSFLQGNLVTLLIALLAINTTTISVIMTKLREITDKNAIDFNASIRSMRVSVIEQMVLVVVAIVVQVLAGSKNIASTFPAATDLWSVLLTAVFAYAIHVLYDTADSVFVILKFENGKDSR